MRTRWCDVIIIRLVLSKLRSYRAKVPNIKFGIVYSYFIKKKLSTQIVRRYCKHGVTLHTPNIQATSSLTCSKYRRCID